MIPFKTVTLCDKPWVDEIVFAEDSPSADYNFGNIYIWDKHYRQLIARCGDRMLTKLRYDGHPAFVFPIGSGPLRPAIEALRAFAAERGYPLVIRGITPAHRLHLDAEYPGRFTYTPEQDNWDYLYLAEKLASYSGKSLHGKKNHCNRFEAENDWEFRPLSYDLIPGCLDMLDVWSEQNSERLDPSVAYEHDAIIRAFAAYEWLGLEGGVLFANGKIVGFSLGEMCSADTFDVHFEKAQIDLNGAYPMVCRELTRMLMEKHPTLRYMNREDDMGLEPLRQSKLSYKPVGMVEKYLARWNDD
ncbi:MAG: phosphatidylglycerol lysyltransferase domain-containing protein [Eubacteriales bacterium]|nr:phosphatidylglycerol lysyltransferase domain-containing protein [Eubacteriales bacterium]